LVKKYNKIEMLSIEINTENKIQKILLSGKLVGLAALEFRQKIGSVLEEQPKRIVLDLRNIKELDLTGFNAVVMLKSITEKRRKSFSMLISADSPIVEYLHLSKLNLNQSIASS